MQNTNLEDSDLQDEEYTGYRGPTKHLLSLPDSNIRDVWADNFEQQIVKMMKLCERFKVIAMDTQFPGICVPRANNIYNQEQSQYDHVRRNVQQTKLIQIGFAIADDSGQTPQPICTWQFNFKFDLKHDRIINQANQLLSKAGIKFDKLQSQGIDAKDFAEYFIASGMVLNKDIKWVVFHGSFDFAYLLRLMKGQQLPLTYDQFYKEMKLYFPKIYDLKYIIKDIRDLKQVGLNRLGEKIGCSRIGPQHQAGSDSLLTLSCYFKMLQRQQTAQKMKNPQLLNVIFGVGHGLIVSAANYNLRDNSRDFLQTNQNDYYQHQRNYPMNMHYSMGVNVNHHVNPLYQYLQQQQQQQNNYIMYSDHRNRY